MKYDKDIQFCRRAMTAIGILQLPGIVTVLIGHAYGLAAVCLIWVYACFVVRRSMDVQQKTRDSQRVITATLDGRLAEEIGAVKLDDALVKRLREPPSEAWIPLETPQEAPSYKCLRCGRVSYHPMDLKHRYCGFCQQFE